MTEAGLALSKLVSKLEAGNRIPDKIHESGLGPGLCKKIIRASSFQDEHRYEHRQPYTSLVLSSAITAGRQRFFIQLTILPQVSPESADIKWN